MTTNDAIRDARLEVEHISGVVEMLDRTRDRFRDIRTEKPIERIDGFRHAVEDTREDFARTIERINRWWRPFDRAFDKLVYAGLVPRHLRAPRV